MSSGACKIEEDNNMNDENDSDIEEETDNNESNDKANYKYFITFSYSLYDASNQLQRTFIDMDDEIKTEDDILEIEELLQDYYDCPRVIDYKLLSSSNTIKDKSITRDDVITYMRKYAEQESMDKEERRLITAFYETIDKLDGIIAKPE